MKRRKAAKALGKRIFLNVTSKLPADTDGECDPPGTPNREIRIKKGLSPERELVVLIHEYLHLSDWHKDEDSWVEPLAEEIGDAILKMGWRKSFEPAR